MRNKALALDYISRSKKRLFALEALYSHEAWADVVRESQEVVELSLKALLIHSNIAAPRVHDVSSVLEAERANLPKSALPHLDQFVEISRRLRRDRELAFYGSEDLTPSEFYKERDAKEAKAQARWVTDTLAAIVK